VLSSDAWTYVPAFTVSSILSAHGQLGTKVVISRTHFLGGGVLIATDSLAGADAEVTDSSNTEVKVVANRFGGILSVSGDSVNVEGDLGCHTSVVFMSMLSVSLLPFELCTKASYLLLELLQVALLRMTYATGIAVLIRANPREFENSSLGEF